jgi:hypothetical protein
MNKRNLQVDPGPPEGPMAKRNLQSIQSSADGYSLIMHKGSGLYLKWYNSGNDPLVSASELMSGDTTFHWKFTSVSVQSGAPGWWKITSRHPAPPNSGYLDYAPPPFDASVSQLYTLSDGYRLVARPEETVDPAPNRQKWLITETGNDFTLKHKSSVKMLHGDAQGSWLSVRTQASGDLQLWKITKPPTPVTLAPMCWQ